MPKEFRFIQIAMSVLCILTIVGALYAEKRNTSVYAQTHTITYSVSGFSPATLTVQKGDTVSWANTSTITFLELASDPHPVHTEYAPLNLGIIDNGSSKSLVMNDSGIFGYHNHLSEQHKGTIVVVAPTQTVTQTPTQTITPIPTTSSGPSATSTPTLTPTTSTSPTPTGTAKQGDSNNDNIVDGIDYVVWLSHYGQITIRGREDGDYNNDGKVDGIDYVIWLTNYGK